MNNNESIVIENEYQIWDHYLSKEQTARKCSCKRSKYNMMEAYNILLNKYSKLFMLRTVSVQR